MVRLMNLIKEGLKSEKEVEKEEDVLRIGDALKRDLNENKDKDLPETSILSQQVENKYQKELYCELLSVTSLILKEVEKGQEIDKKFVDILIPKVIEEFRKNLYNDLSLFSYFASEEDYLTAHIVNGLILSIGFSSSLGLSDKDLADIGTCAFFHDIGMVFFEKFYSKVCKKEEEFSEIKKHPVKSVEVVKGIIPEDLCTVIIDIHERENGQGYPEGKTGDQILPFAKIIALCDVYEALTHPRRFRDYYSPFEAMKILVKMKTTLFEQRLLKEFVEFMSIYPMGSIVYLNTGEIGVVVGSNKSMPTRPKVRVVLTTELRIQREQKIIDLSQTNLVYIRGPVDKQNEKDILYLLKPRGDPNICKYVNTSMRRT